MSKASVDFPEPETPVMTVKRSRGIAHVDVLQVVLARVVDDDCVPAAAGGGRVSARRRRLRQAGAPPAAGQSACCVGGERLAGEGARRGAHLRGGAGADDLPAALATLGAEVDDPVGRADHVEVVLDDE